MRHKRKKSLNRVLLLLLFLNVVLYALIAGKVFISKLDFNTANISLPESHKKEAQKIADKCENLPHRESCYSDQFRELTKKTNMAFAKNTLSALQDIDPTHSRGCHLIAHYIAIAETQKNPEKWMELLKQVDSNTCTGGYVHGILEAHTGADPNFRITAKEIPRVCSFLPDANAGGDINCSHNLGHILLAQENNSIPKSVDICNQLDAGRVQYECLSGVFMERMTRLNLEAHEITTRIPWNEKNTAEMEQICREYTGTPALTCWREVSHMFAVLNQNEPEKVFASCNNAPESDFARDCYLHASSIMVVSSNFDQENLNKVCLVYNETDPLYDMCMSHVIGGMILSSEKFSETVLKLCSETSNNYKETCYKKIGNSLAGSVPSAETREKICSQAPEEYRSMCSSRSIQKKS